MTLAVALGSLATGVVLVAIPSGCDGGEAETRTQEEVAQDIFLSDPTWSPTGGWIALSGSVIGEPNGIFVVRPDGRGLVRLTPRSLPAWNPVWSPDGTRIAFVSPLGDLAAAKKSELYVVAVDGSGLKQLTSNHVGDLHPAWSPDGTRIAFASSRNGPADIYTMTATGAGLRRLTRQRGLEGFPSWSPDGRSIAYVNVFDGVYSQVWVVAATGGPPRRLTFGPAASDKTLVAWSPRGDRIAFVDGAELTTVNVAGPSARSLKGPTPGSCNPWCQPAVFAWAPDGKRIAYAGFETCTVAVESGRATPLAEHSTLGLSWSPDGRRIAMVVGGSPRDYRLVTVRADGRGGAKTVVDRLD